MGESARKQGRRARPLAPGSPSVRTGSFAALPDKNPFGLSRLPQGDGCSGKLWAPVVTASLLPGRPRGGSLAGVLV